MEVFIVVLETPNDNPTYRVVGVFGNIERATAAGVAEAAETGNGSRFTIHRDDGHDLNADGE